MLEASTGQPQEGVEPVDELEDHTGGVDPEIAAFDVCEFVEEDVVDVFSRYLSQVRAG